MADLADLADLAAVAGRLERFVSAGLAEWRQRVLVINQKGLPYARAIAAALDPYRHHAATRFSSAI
jgi:oxygen-independent coproporphyrinogen-3 oxidase